MLKDDTTVSDKPPCVFYVNTTGGRGQLSVIIITDELTLFYWLLLITLQIFWLLNMKEVGYFRIIQKQSWV